MCSRPGCTKSARGQATCEEKLLDAGSARKDLTLGKQDTRDYPSFCVCVLPRSYASQDRALNQPFNLRTGEIPSFELGQKHCSVMASSQGLYRTLGPGEIRVLDVQPGHPGSVSECCVRIVQLGENPSFHALSYTWGTGSKEIPVHCGSHVVLVTLSLSQALQRLRKPDKIYTVWIDQICINQVSKAKISCWKR
jgi:hypothetical protein